MRIGSLFSGIGGLELGLLRAIPGSVVRWQVEKDPFCRQVLAKHWPNTVRYPDVKTFDAGHRDADLVCGGFPCQPFSSASRGRMVAEDLWPEMLRIVSEIYPRFVVAENVARKPIQRAGDSLEAIGYSCCAIEMEAKVAGAPHGRSRWFLVADSDSNGKSRLRQYAKVASLSDLSGLERWQNDPGPVGMDDGIPRRMDRLRALGNAVVPQCAEVIGYIINELMAQPNQMEGE